MIGSSEIDICAATKSFSFGRCFSHYQMGLHSFNGEAFSNVGTPSVLIA
jgi:hypothetical protein